MELENMNILVGKITTILEQNLLNDFKKINTSTIPDNLFGTNLLEDIKYNNPNYDEECLNEMLNQFGLDKSILNRRFNNISKSEYKKICIIIAILDSKPILLLENPTVGLDVKSKKNLIKMLKRERKRDRIIIITSTDSEFLFKAVNYVIYKDNTRYVINDNKYNFFSNKRLLKAYDLVEPNIIEFYSQVRKKTKIRLINRDNINDLIKEIYRNA